MQAEGRAPLLRSQLSISRSPQTFSAACLVAATLLLASDAHSTTRAAAQDTNSPTAAPVPLYSLLEELRIAPDGSSRAKTPTAVSALVTLSNGNIVTAHPSERLIRIFADDGTFVRFIGASGQGMGELTGLTAIGVVRDTIWVSDSNNSVVSFFTSDGRFQRIIPIALRSPQPSGRGTTNTAPFTSLDGVLAGGRSVATQRWRAAADPVRRGLGTLDSSVTAIRDAAGQLLVRVLKSTGAEHPAMSFRQNGMGTIFDQPLNPRSLVSVAPGGEHFVVTSDAAIFGGQPGQVRITELSAAGVVVNSTVSLPPWRLPANYADSVSALFAGLRANAQSKMSIALPSVDSALLARLVREQLHVPEYYPVNREVHLGRDGSIWLNYRYDGESWAVIVDGRLQMRVRVPDGLRVYQVSRDTVWGVRTDANNLPVILRYRVVPSGSAPRT